MSHMSADMTSFVNEVVGKRKHPVVKYIRAGIVF